jgi:predicted Rdx family selenoprotein
MADYYTHLSFVVTGTAEEQERLVEMLDEANQLADESLEPNLGADYEIDADGVWIHDADGYVELELLSEVLANWLDEIGSTKSIGFEWANTCSKPRLDAFGGGAMVIRAFTATEWLSTSRWLQEEQASQRA